MARGQRIDEALVEQGLAPNLPKARALIMAGQVIVNDHRVDKAGTRIKLDATVRVKLRKAHGFVSRGGLKLAHALTHFKIDPTGWTCLDLGASTGGFTDCLLQNRARRVYSVDVGYGLLDWKLMQDPRVLSLERTHIRDLNADKVPEPIDLVVADISFNALGRLLPGVLPLLSGGARAVGLVKPQFELDAAEIPTGGVVVDPAGWIKACDRVSDAVTTAGWQVQGITRSPITGADGNVEFLLYAIRPITE